MDVEHELTVMPTKFELQIASRWLGIKLLISSKSGIVDFFSLCSLVTSIFVSNHTLSCDQWSNLKMRERERGSVSSSCSGESHPQAHKNWRNEECSGNEMQ